MVRGAESIIMRDHHSIQAGLSILGSEDRKIGRPEDREIGRTSPQRCRESAEKIRTNIEEALNNVVVFHELCVSQRSLRLCGDFFSSSDLPISRSSVLPILLQGSIQSRKHKVKSVCTRSETSHLS